MDSVKKEINGLKGMLSIAVMEDQALTAGEIKEIYSTLKKIESVIEQEELNKSEDVIYIPNLPKGDEYNAFPRMAYIFVCQTYSANKPFTIYDMADFIGASRTQVKADLNRLEEEGYIRKIGGHVGERSLRYYRYAPINKLN